ncbi:MAG: glycosyltransferase [Acidimicrobiia bacterium]|nr:glycosyltransferase [Acidimicrobiia bacterium]
MKNSKVSIIVRTKNEERWIDKCLAAIAEQHHKNHEVIVVDNDSTDATVAKAMAFAVKVVKISQFRPGEALNVGIRASSGDVIVCLSAHCIPTAPDWLGNLIAPLANTNVAGVYGRQEPLPFSDPHDKRDLLTVFGLDRKDQQRDPFFHNANSAILRSTWEKFPFDEQVKNLEDRVWGQAVIDAGRTIVYEPSASVYHWHGIHQGLDAKRAHGVVRVMESIHGESVLPDFLSPERQNNLVVIPVRAQPEFALQSELLQSTVLQAKELTRASRVIVSTDSSPLAEVARAAGAEVPFLRPAALADRSVDIIDVVRHALTEAENTGPIPDAVVLMEVSYPLRRVADVSSMIDRLYSEGLEVVVPGRRERRGLWADQDGAVVQVGEGFKPRDLKTTTAYIGLLGYGTAIRTAALRSDSPFAARVGVFHVDDEFAALEFRPSLDLDTATALLKHRGRK